ncbi:MAG TPA: DinB family protein [Terriglobales bacterium]|nr:DinB family protein [Terriglobales bacterium]
MPDKDKNDHALREHVLYLLGEGGAHLSFDDAIKGFPADKRGVTPEGLDHSVWDLVEHIRLAQWDILEFSRNRKHQSPKWPEGYWPAKQNPSAGEWNASVKKVRADVSKMQGLVKNPKTDLFAKIPWGDGQTILREALLVADHNAYHVAQIVDVRKLLGVWNK